MAKKKRTGSKQVSVRMPAPAMEILNTLVEETGWSQGRAIVEALAWLHWCKDAPQVVCKPLHDKLDVARQVKAAQAEVDRLLSQARKVGAR
jgi:hypothetical protein